MKILIIDLETGGFNSQTDAICSISYKILGSKADVVTHYIKPYDKNYNEEALRINGLTIEKLEKEGILLCDALRSLKNWIKIHSNHIKHNIKLLGQDLRFDIGFLEEEIKYIMQDSLFSWCHYHYKDTMIIADYLKDKKIINPESIKLTILYEYFFGNDNLLSNAHTGEADVLMTEKVYLKMLEL